MLADQDQPIRAAGGRQAGVSLLPGMHAPSCARPTSSPPPPPNTPPLHSKLEVLRNPLRLVEAPPTPANHQRQTLTYLPTRPSWRCCASRCAQQKLSWHRWQAPATRCRRCGLRGAALVLAHPGQAAPCLQPHAGSAAAAARLNPPPRDPSLDLHLSSCLLPYRAASPTACYSHTSSACQRAARSRPRCPSSTGTLRLHVAGWRGCVWFSRLHLFCAATCCAWKVGHYWCPKAAQKGSTLLALLNTITLLFPCIMLLLSRRYVYDGELEAQMVMVFDSNKQLLKGGWVAPQGRLEAAVVAA